MWTFEHATNSMDLICVLWNRREARFMLPLITRGIHRCVWPINIALFGRDEMVECPPL